MQLTAPQIDQIHRDYAMLARVMRTISGELQNLDSTALYEDVFAACSRVKRQADKAVMAISSTAEQRGE